jgi:hypothetical protein
MPSANSRTADRSFGRSVGCSIARIGRLARSSEKLRHYWRFESWQQRTVAPAPRSAEPTFSVAALFDICAIANFSSGSHQGIRPEERGCLALMIRRLRRCKCSPPLSRAWTEKLPFRSRRSGSTRSNPGPPGRSRTVCSRFRNQCRCRLIPLHPEARKAN